ncbi:MAG: sulfite exporter TauE/SafE family protein [Chloroflexota bacterium]|nr:sulfite exporter TauE/SafE family protein [Chloroflexota bacterium]
MPLYELLLFALSLLAGAVAALAGFGIGSLLTPALAVSVGTKLAVAAVAVPHLVATTFRLWMLRKSIDRSVLLTFGLASAAGGLAGAVLHGFLSSPLLAIVLGVLLVFAGVSELTGLARRFRLGGRMAFVAGVLSGLFGGLVGNQGGIRSAALLRFDVSGPALVATATAIGLLVDLARVPVYLLTSASELAEMWPIVLTLTAGVLIGTVVGAPVLRRLPQPLFRRLLAFLLLALGILLIVGIR